MRIVACLVAMFLLVAMVGRSAADGFHLGDMSVLDDPREGITLKFGETVLLREGAGQVRTDWKSPPLMDLLSDSASALAKELPGARRLVCAIEAKGVGTFRRELYLLPDECIITWDAKLDTPHEHLLGKTDVLIPHETMAGRTFRLIDGWGRTLSGTLGAIDTSARVHSRADGGYTKISDHLDVLPGILAPDFRVPKVRQLAFDVGDRTVCMDLACEADGQYAIGEFQGDVRKREPYHLSLGFVSKAKSFRLRAVLRLRILSEKKTETDFEEWTLNNDLLDVIDDGFSLTLLRDRKWALTGESVRVKVGRVGAPPIKEELPVKYVLADYWDRTVEQGDFRIELGADSPSEGVLSFAIQASGMYRLSLQYNVPATDRVRERQAIFAVLPRLSGMPKDTLFGAHVPLTEYYAKLAAAAGVNWVRLWHTTIFRQNMWDVVEPKQGQFVFDDREIQLAKKYGFNLLCDLQGVPTWLDSGDHPERVGYARGFEGMDKVLPPWLEYVKRSVAHYKDSIRHWEVLNEPGFSHGFFRKHPEVYFRLLKATYETIKSTDPNAVVIGSNGPVGWGTNWYEAIFQLGGLRFQDAVSIHYAGRKRCSVPSWDIEGAQGIQFIRDLMRKHGDAKPIWNTEDHVWIDGFFYGKTAPAEQRDTGLYDPSALPLPVYHETCNRLVRLYLLHLTENIRCFYLHWFGNGWWHLCERDHTPTPPIVAYAVMADLLAGAEYKGHFVGHGIQCHLLQRRKGGRIAVLFANDSDGEGTLTIPIEAQKLTRINIMGNECPVAEGEKAARLPITREPAYLLGKDVSPDEFAAAIRAAKLALPNGTMMEPWDRGETPQPQ